MYIFYLYLMSIDIPLGILFGGGFVLILYLLLQTVTQGILGAEIGAVSDAPLAAVAESIVGPLGGVILLIATAISCFGSVSTDILNTPRVVYAGASDGLFPKFLSKIHPKFATPYWSISCFVGLIFIFSILGNFEQLALLASAAILLIYLLVVLAMIKLRLKKQVNDQMSFKVPGGFIVPIIGVASILWCLSSLSKAEVVSTLIFIGVVSAIYFTMKWIKKRYKTES